jgi:hypothetical protein
MFQFNTGDPATFWLNATNIALGVVTLVCCLVMVRAFAREFFARSRQRTQASSQMDRELKALLADDHAFHVPGLGMTMADGGERSDEDDEGGRAVRR